MSGHGNTLSVLCEAALQTETKHDTSVIGGLVKIAEHNESLVTIILLMAKIADTKCQDARTFL